MLYKSINISRMSVEWTLVIYLIRLFWFYRLYRLQLYVNTDKSAGYSRSCIISFSVKGTVQINGDINGGVFAEAVISQQTLIK